MITENDLFDIFSDSHFMQQNKLRVDELNDLVTLVMEDLNADIYFQSLVAEQGRIEDSINQLVADTINNLVKKPAPFIYHEDPLQQQSLEYQLIIN